MNSRLNKVGLALLLTACSPQSGLQAQSAANPPSTPEQISSVATSNLLDQDPDAVLKLASAQNGLDFQPSVPWHVKLTYEQFDEDGDNVHSGSFDEFYVGPKKYKKVFTGDVFNQVDVATSSGLYRSGDESWPGIIQLQLQTEVLDPLHRATLNRDHTKAKEVTQSIGKSQLPCVVLKTTGLSFSPYGPPTFCFDQRSVRLRYTRGKGSDETVYNGLFVFQDRSVARDTVVTHAGKPYLKIHLQTVEAIDLPNEATFTQPPASSLVGDRISVPSGYLVDEYLISSGTIVANGEQGKVKVHFVVGKEGRVIEADVLNGPDKLRKTAIKTMREYRFRPFLILDQPVEVEGTMEFQYN